MKGTHLVSRKNPLSSCSLSSSVKMGKKSFFIGFDLFKSFQSDYISMDYHR
jgi:hypothetical protein